ncbi:MAG: FitA-like ribbon-helix-helix domain-containing protein [Verrucomicrobiales bacterium]
MATITLKNIPELLHRTLQERAKANHRSINREAIDCLERVVLGKPLDALAFLEKVRCRRRETPGQLADDLLWEARHTGRP